MCVASFKVFILRVWKTRTELCTCLSGCGCLRSALIQNDTLRYTRKISIVCTYTHTHTHRHKAALLTRGELLVHWNLSLFTVYIDHRHDRSSSQTWNWPLLESNLKCTLCYIRDILIYEYSNWNPLEWNYSETRRITSQWQSVFHQYYVMYELHMLPFIFPFKTDIDIIAMLNRSRTDS